MNKKVILEFDAKTGKAVVNIDALNEAVEKTKESTSETNDQFQALGETADQATGGLVSGFKSGLKGVKTFIGGMTSLKAALISTGVGALVVALGTLVQWFSTSEKGAKVFSTAGYALEALFKSLTDRLNTFLEADLVSFFEDPQQAIKDLGKFLMDNLIKRFEGILLLVPRLAEAVGMLFKGDFEGAAKTAGNAVLQISTGMEDTIGVVEEGIKLVKEVAAEVVKETEKAIEQGGRLANLEDRLIKATAAFTVEQARLNTEIDKQQKIIDDTTRSFDERAEALDKQSELSLKLAKEIANQAALEEATIQATLSLTANYKERLELQQQLAEAQADRIEKIAQVAIVELENAQKRTEIDLEEFERQKSITQQIEDLRTENIENERERIQTEMELALQRSLQDLELLKATEEEKQAIKEQYAIATNKALAEFDAEAAKAKEDADNKQIEDDKKVAEAKVQIQQNALGSITGLLDVFGGNNERAAKKVFKVNQALGVAEAVVNTSRAIMAQLSNPKDALTGANFVKAGIAAATGLAQVIKIKNTKFGGGGDSPSTSISDGGGAGATPQIPQQPEVDFGFLQQGENQNTIQAYVLEQNVSSSQQANQLIQDQAVL